MTEEVLMPRWISKDGQLKIEIQGDKVFYSTGRISSVSTKNEMGITEGLIDGFTIIFENDANTPIQLLSKDEAIEVASLIEDKVFLQSENLTLTGM